MSINIIDEEIFNQLIDLDDTGEFVKEIIQNFFSQLDEKIPELENELKLKNFEEVGKIGHFLKGAAATIGAVNIKKLCEEIQLYEHLSTALNHEEFLFNRIQYIKKEIPITKIAFTQKIQNL